MIVAEHRRQKVEVQVFSWRLQVCCCNMEAAVSQSEVEDLVERMEGRNQRQGVLGPAMTFRLMKKKVQAGGRKIEEDEAQGASENS
jgi:hypothetical protein